MGRAGLEIGVGGVLLALSAALLSSGVLAPIERSVGDALIRQATLLAPEPAAGQPDANRMKIKEIIQANTCLLIEISGRVIFF